MAAVCSAASLELSVLKGSLLGTVLAEFHFTPTASLLAWWLEYHPILLHVFFKRVGGIQIAAFGQHPIIYSRQVLLPWWIFEKRNQNKACCLRDQKQIVHISLS
jgi:hypothetical protein